MKKVLVIGATDAMGRYLVPELVSLGYMVTGVGLDAAPPWGAPASYIRGDAFDKEFLKELLDRGFDGIVNLMDYGGHPFSEYYRLFLDRTSHYIFLSSCRVYDDKEQPVRETSPRTKRSVSSSGLMFSGFAEMFFIVNRTLPSCFSKPT